MGTPQHLLDERYGPSQWWSSGWAICAGCDTRQRIDEPCPICAVKAAQRRHT